MKRASPHFAVTVAILAGTLGAMSLGRHTAGLEFPLQTIPAEFDGWASGMDETLTEEVEQVLGATSYLLRTYRRGQADAGIFVAYYSDERSGAVPHSPTICLPGSGWEEVKHAPVEVRGAEGAVPVIEYVVKRQTDQLLVLYWYQSRGAIHATDPQRRLGLAWNAFVRGARGGTIVRIAMADRPGARSHAMALASRLIAEVKRCLGG